MTTGPDREWSDSWKKKMAHGEKIQARKAKRAARVERHGGPESYAVYKKQRREQSKARAVIAHCIQEAIADRGGKKLFIDMIDNGGEDRRCVVNVAARLIPSEVISSNKNDISVTIRHYIIDQGGRVLDGKADRVALPEPVAVSDG